MNFKALKQKSVTLMMVIIVAKLIGMLRDVILANYFGTSNISDAYLIASTVPTLLFYFIGHSLSTAYIPMYNKVKQEQGRDASHRYTSNLLTIALVLSTVIVIALLVFPKAVVKVFAVGFDRQTAKIAARLIRISAPSIYLMTIVNICGGYLQANKSFLVPASISLPRNAAIVVSVILAASLGTDLLGWGLLASYLLEFLFLLPFVLKKGYRYKPTLKLKDADIKQTLYIVTPILLGMCVGQVNKIIDRSMASTVVEGGISALTYASIINNAVQEVLVTGIITILFASCAELVAKQEHEKVKKKLADTVSSLLFLLIPAAVGVIILAEPIVHLVLCRGEFDEHSLKMTVSALRCYTVGLLFLALRDTFVKIFYAYKETKITTITSICSIVLNIALNIVLGKLIGINGLALATSFSALFNCITLFALLNKKIGDFGTVIIAKVTIKSIVGAIIMSVGVYLSRRTLTPLLGDVVSLIISIIIGCIIYFTLALLFVNEPAVKVFHKIIRKNNPSS